MNYMYMYSDIALLHVYNYTCHVGMSFYDLSEDLAVKQSLNRKRVILERIDASRYIYMYRYTHNL